MRNTRKGDRSHRDGIPRDAHIIDDGRVGCPVSGVDIDLDACFGCARLEQIVDVAGEPWSYVVCQGPPQLAALSGYTDYPL